MTKSAELRDLRTAVLVTMSVLLAVALAVAATVCFALKLVQLAPDAFPEAEQVASIRITSEVTDQRLTLEDPEEIAGLLEQLEKPCLLLGTYNDANGFPYQFSLRDASGKTLCSVCVAGESYLVVGNYTYRTNASALYRFIAGLDWSQAEGL